MAVAMVSRPVFTDVTNVNGYVGASSARCSGGLARDVVPGRRAPLQAVPVGTSASSSISIYEDISTNLSRDEHIASREKLSNKPHVIRDGWTRTSSGGAKGKPRDDHGNPVKGRKGSKVQQRSEPAPSVQDWLQDSETKEAAVSDAISSALALNENDVATMKLLHGRHFFALGDQAEKWIQSKPGDRWTCEKGQLIIAQLSEATKPDENKYYAACLLFKEIIEANDRSTKILKDAVTIQAAEPRKQYDELAKKAPVACTQLSVLIEAYRFSPVMDDRVEAVVAELVDDVLLTSHRESQRYLPKPEELISRLGNGQREPILDWLVQACDIMRLPDGTVYSTVLTLDRYCASCREPVATENMQKVLMAVICTVLKTCAVADEVCMPLRDLLLHLCRGQVSFEDILVMEHRVLQTLQFKGLFAPTALEFLEALKFPLTHWLGDAVDAASAFDLANFLIQLSFFNAALHYSHPHLVLAASALYVALCHMQCSPTVVQNLLSDVAAVAPDISDVNTAVMTCGTQLHSLWLDFAAVQGDRVPCLLRKFNMNVLLNPPAALIPPCPAEQWHLWSTSILTDAPQCCHNCGLHFAGAPYITPEMTPIPALCPNCSSHTYGNIFIH